LCWNKNEHRKSRVSCVPKGVDDDGERDTFFFIFIVEREWLRGVRDPIFFPTVLLFLSSFLPTLWVMTGPIGQRVLT
jgi:hypothetical protein